MINAPITAANAVAHLFMALLPVTTWSVPGDCGGNVKVSRTAISRSGACCEALSSFASSPGPLLVERVRCVYSIGSRRALVLVQESTELVATFHRYRLRPRQCRRWCPPVRRHQVETAMRPPTIVMIDEFGERAVQMPDV